MLLYLCRINCGERMKKITIAIKDNSLIFKFRTNKPVGPNLLNTNVISNNELVFSDEYIKENSKLVSLFICDLFKEREIKEVVISNNELGILMIDIIKKLPIIEKLIIMDDDNLSYSMCEVIVKSKNIKVLDCYGIPQFMIEELDNHGIKVNSRNEVLFTSNFMAENNLTSFSKIYYKTNIRINDVLTREDIEDIKTFLAINKYLKVIHFDRYSSDNINLIVSLLKNAKVKNKVIQIHDDLDDANAITNLRNLNKELKKKYRLKISLIYSKDYLEKNYLQQIIFTTLKICALIIFAIVVSVCGYILYNNHVSETKIKQIKDDIEDIMSEESTDNKENNVINSYDKLREINSDIVGWLKVPGTNIDYPVVRTTDNSYYLTRNVYKEKDYNGWVFMDYRNSIDILDDNTIIYAHNRFTSGVMFGTLPKIRKKDWLKKEENHYITFNSLYEEGTWRVFSIYGIDVTSDYLLTNFLDKDEKMEFLNMLKDRSEYDFGVELDEDDKILTLSTCLDNNERFVVHAVLVTDEES